MFWDQGKGLGLEGLREPEKPGKPRSLGAWGKTTVPVNEQLK
jgi:hypothetical protein